MIKTEVKTETPTNTFWLQQRAIKNENNGVSRTFIVWKGNTVLDFYSLAVGAVTRKGSTKYAWPYACNDIRTISR